MPSVQKGVDVGADAPVESDTIVAISTAAGPGAIGIVRMSGPQAVAIGAQVFRPHRGRDLGAATSFSLTYGHVVEPATERVLDEVIVGLMRSPRSYTREDVVEFHCHGGVLAVRSVMELLLRLGARIAEPGEFTRRAFINGRIDLAQAESVAAVVAARSTGALRASVHQLSGGLSQRLSTLRAMLVETLAWIEADVDFSEEEVEALDRGTARETLDVVQTRLEELLETALLGHVLQHGVRVAIVGKPNAGKSSVMNALAMRDRAIVSDIPGTTRDTVESALEIEGIPVRLVDTAGLRTAGDSVERLGMDRTLETLKEADLVLVVVDLAGVSREGVGAAAEAAETIRLAEGRPCIVVCNKVDLVGGNSTAFGEMCAEVGAATPTLGAGQMSAGEAGGERLWAREVSALTGEGIRELRELIGVVVSGGSVDVEEPILGGERQRLLVAEACDSVERASVALSEMSGEELVAEDLRCAVEALGRITGEDLSPDLLDEIFGRFCVGK